jgi:uncharacterized protein YndB with AHSA1/START domain
MSNGTLETIDGKPTIRFTRRLSHSPERVWRALTEPDELKKWFPDTIVVESWEPGATLHFKPAPDVADAFEGEVLQADPPRVLEFRWGTDVIRFELEPDGDGGTTLTLKDTIDQVGKAARDGAGWHVCLDGLEHALDGTEPEWSMQDRWREVHPAYVSEMGPHASTIGPPG